MRANEQAIEIEIKVALPFTAEEWAQTPESVQGFVLSLLHRMQELEEEIGELKERVNRNSQNSSQPPSTSVFLSVKLAPASLTMPLSAFPETVLFARSKAPSFRIWKRLFYKVFLCRSI